MKFKSKAQRSAVMIRLKKAGKVKVKRARDYGDNPNIRRSHGEHTSTHKEQPWEVRYRRQKRKKRRK